MCGVVVWKMTLKTVRFTGTAFMQSTSRSRLTFKRLLLLMSGVTICPFPMIDRGLEWYKAFSQDHDADYLLQGSAHGFSYRFTDPDPGGEYYRVPNYVPDEHAHKMEAWVKLETTAGRYIPVDRDFARGTAALGVVDKDHSNMEKVRAVHNLSRPEGVSTNDGIDIPQSSLPTVGDAFVLLQPGWYQAKVDMTSAYRSVPVHPAHWRYQCGEWDEAIFADCALSFGLRAAPPLFDRITQACVRALKASGIHAVVGYIDDFWVAARTKKECRWAYNFVITFLTALGFVVNQSKCVPPTKRLTFLGFDIDSDADGVCLMTIPDAKRERGIELCADFLASVPQAGGRCAGYRSAQYERLVGFLAHCACVAFGSRLHLTRLYHSWRFARRFAFSPSAVAAAAMRVEVSWWMRLFQSTWILAERSLRHRARIAYYYFATDASTSWGMGGFFNGDYFSMSWKDLAKINRSSYFPDLADENGTGHVNYLELFAVYWAMAKWGALLTNSVVVLHLDSMVALHCMHKMATSSLIFVPLLQAIVKLLIQHDVRVHVTYISSAANILADLLSRDGMTEFRWRRTMWMADRSMLGRDFEDWMLHGHIFWDLVHDFGSVSVTACADEFGRNSHTARFWSAIDSCMGHSWSGMLVWANPPFSLIAAILRHFLRCKQARPIGTALLLLVPVWDSDWYRVIKVMSRTFIRVRYWPKHADLFTAPPFPCQAGNGRRLCGTTRWAVEIYYVGPGPMVESPPPEFMSGRPFRR